MHAWKSRPFVILFLDPGESNCKSHTSLLSTGFSKWSMDLDGAVVVFIHSDQDLHDYIYIEILIDILFFLPFVYKNSVIVALLAGRLKHSFCIWKTRESGITVSSIKSFLEDFVTITRIVHAVQRRAKTKLITIMIITKKKKDFQEPQNLSHTQVDNV